MHQLIKNSQFLSGNIQIGKKHRMLHGRKVDFTLCNFAALASLVQQALHSVKIAYFPPL